MFSTKLESKHVATTLPALFTLVPADVDTGENDRNSEKELLDAEEFCMKYGDDLEKSLLAEVVPVRT